MAEKPIQDMAAYVDEVARRARTASRALATASAAAKNRALEKIVELLNKNEDEILKANAEDARAGRASGLSEALLDRLTLNAKRYRSMVDGAREVIGLVDPVGEIIRGWRRPNGLLIQKTRTPLGVVAILYESRPNVTVDAAVLCLKSGNACILRGGKESIHSNRAIARVLADALAEAGPHPWAIQLVETTDREAVGLLLKHSREIDVVIPRGGPGLIQRVVEESTIPVIKHYMGICHTYVDKSADLKMAAKICMNAKTQRPATCNAMETLLVHEKIAAEFLPAIAREMRDAGVELRGDQNTRKLVPWAKAACEEDWRTEYLDLILSVRVVKGLDEAIEHINTYGSAHSDAIVTSDLFAANRFLREVDSAAVYVNASTRFTDGGQFGFGAEIGISTDKLHARGPMALEELTTYKYVIIGEGQIRES